MRRRIVSWTLLVTFGLGSVVALVPITATSVFAKCNPKSATRTDDGHHYWDGWVRGPGTTVGGVGSDILNYSPWVNSGFTMSWTMVLYNSLYAQVGWIEQPFGTRSTFTEYTTSDGVWHRKYFNPQPTGLVSRYTTLYGNKPGLFSFWVNGSDIDDETAQFTPNLGKNQGEVSTYANQMAGGYNAHETFRNTQIYYSGAWHSFSGGGHTDAAPFHYSTGDGGVYALDIWDEACP